MNKERQGQIALLFLKYKLERDGVHISPNISREIGNTAKALGISPEEATEFAEIIVRGVVDKAFPPKQ